MENQEAMRVSRVRMGSLDPCYDIESCKVGNVHEICWRMRNEGYFITEELLENLVKKKMIPFIKDGKQGYLLHYDTTCEAVVKAITKEE